MLTIKSLTKAKEFDNVFKNGNSRYTKIAGVKILKNNSSVIKLGIIISKKVSKKAVKRNKIKRQIKNIFSLILANFNQGVDIIIIVLPTIIEADYLTISDEITTILNKLKILSV